MYQDDWDIKPVSQNWDFCNRRKDTYTLETKVFPYIVPLTLKQSIKRSNFDHHKTLCNKINLKRHKILSPEMSDLQNRTVIKQLLQRL